LHEKHIAFIRLIAPTTPEERLPMLLDDADGFVYTIAIKGITGTSSSSSANLQTRIATIREYTDLPIAAGFGIKTPEQVKELVGIADAAVIGSALVDAIHKSDPQTPEDAATAASEFLKPFKAVL
jgi:tryptophan synthase alpha chain